MDVDPVLTNCVYLIAVLPPTLSIIPESEEQEKLVVIYQNYYKGLSLWLRNLLLREALLPEAYESYPNLQPHAEFYVAMADLILAVHRSSGNAEIRDYSSPAELWYHWVRETSVQDLEEIGLTGKVVTYGGKEAHYKLTSNVCSSLEKLEFKSDRFPMYRGLSLLIMEEAQALARADDQKRFLYHHLKPFVKAWRRTAKTVKKCKALKDVFLKPDGTLFFTEDKKKLPRGL